MVKLIKHIKRNQEDTHQMFYQPLEFNCENISWKSKQDSSCIPGQLMFFIKIIFFTPLQMFLTILSDGNLKKKVSRKELERGKARSREMQVSSQLIYVSIELSEETYKVGKLWFHQRGARQSASFEYDPGWVKHPEKFALEPAAEK